MLCCFGLHSFCEQPSIHSICCFGILQVQWHYHGKDLAVLATIQVILPAIPFITQQAFSSKGNALSNDIKSIACSDSQHKVLTTVHKWQWGFGKSSSRMGHGDSRQMQTKTQHQQYFVVGLPIPARSGSRGTNSTQLSCDANCAYFEGHPLSHITLQGT